MIINAFSFEKEFDTVPPNRKAPDFINLVARRMMPNLPEGWCWFQLIGLTNPESFTVRGGLPHIDGDGKPIWKHTKITKLVIQESDLKFDKIQYEIDTGFCSECGGGSKVLAGWNKNIGSYYRPCKKCGGTGMGHRISTN